MSSLLRWCLGTLLLAVSASGAEPFFSRQNILTRGTEGYAAFRIPGLVATRGGALLLFCDGRVHSTGDIGKMNLVLKRSPDGGKTWEKVRTLFDDPGPETKIGNVTAVVDRQTGDVHAVFCKDLVQAYALTSKDEGQTFQPAVEITEAFRHFLSPWVFFAAGHAHGLQLASGRLLLPIFLSETPRVGAHERKPFHAGALYSDDHGAHWQAGGLVPDGVRMNENTIYEAADGSVVLNARTTSAERESATSRDGGLTWSKPEPSPLFGAKCQAASLVTRDPAGQRIVLFSNPARASRGGLTVRVSYDDGRTWPFAKLVDEKAAAYGDLSEGPDGRIHLAYEAGEKSPYDHIAVASFNVEWLLSEPQAPLVGDRETEVSENAPKLDAGVVVDDSAATLRGEWGKGVKAGLVGKGYQHDKAEARGEKSARFTPKLPVAGPYEVRLIYPITPKSSSKVKVTILSVDGEKTVTVNELKPPASLGVFPFNEGSEGRVTISNEGADGFVIIDGVQFIPSAISSEVKEKHYDLVVTEATPGGVATAVRAAREGLTVLLTNHTQHLGGMMTNGLGVWDTLYEGSRSPIYDELRQAIFTYYKETYGADSPQYKACLPGPRTQSSPRGYYEPHVAEALIDAMVAREKNITVLRGYYPAAAEVADRLLRTVTLREYQGQGELLVSAAMFADGSYEGDLLAVAKAPYRVGRESRTEFGEPHAGVVFAETLGLATPEAKYPQEAMAGRLNLRGFRATTGRLFPGSTGEGDRNIQAFNFRLTLTSDPQNLVPPEKPAHYRREDFLGKTSPRAGEGPNHKASWNEGKLIGQQAAYPEGDWATREAITQRLLERSLGWLYFVQNDESISAEVRARNRRIGLPKDEYPDHGHVPYESYVREARRLVGRTIFTEHDALFAPGLLRAPIHEDAIAITEWPMDSHECTDRQSPEGGLDGKILLSEETRPGQLPYRALLAPNLDNLLVPVCVSATHLGWGTVRLEPTWLQIGESAGFAAALAKKANITPAALDPDQLLRTLAEHRVMLSFFNDADLAASDPATPACQFLGTKGFFSSYDARLKNPLDPATAKAWAALFTKLAAGEKINPTEQARTLPAPADGKIKAAVFARLLGPQFETALGSLGIDPSGTISRGDACRLIYQLLDASAREKLGGLPGSTSYVFKTIGETKLRLHVFPPATRTALSPALILFFGGGWRHGSPAQFAPQAAYFAARGLTVILPEYRTKEAHGTTPFECIADGKSAVRWVRTHAQELGIDPAKIAVGGGSAGGHVAAATAILTDLEEPGADIGTSCRPDALVLFNPVLDTTRTGYGSQVLGTRAEEASPVHHLRAGVPPTVIFHGRADTTAPFANTEHFAAEMKTLGNACTVFAYDGQQHGFYLREPYFSATLRQASDFLAGLGWLRGEPGKQ